MKFIDLSNEGRIIGFRSGSYQLADKTPSEMVAPASLPTNFLMGLLSPEGVYSEDAVTQAYREGLITPAPPPAGIQQIIVQATQDRLDNFARTRNYDGILSAATYAASTIPKFAAEGQYAVLARDTTWATLYSILEEVQAGTRPVPSGFSDVEADLPELTWPEDPV